MKFNTLALAALIPAIVGITSAMPLNGGKPSRRSDDSSSDDVSCDETDFSGQNGVVFVVVDAENFQKDFVLIDDDPRADLQLFTDIPPPDNSTAPQLQFLFQDAVVGRGVTLIDISNDNVLTLNNNGAASFQQMITNPNNRAAGRQAFEINCTTCDFANETPGGITCQIFNRATGTCMLGVEGGVQFGSCRKSITQNLAVALVADSDDSSN